MVGFHQTGFRPESATRPAFPEARMRFIPTRALTAFACMTLLLVTLAAPAAARETRTLADRWTVEIGFEHEPAIQADTNALWLRVAEGDKPVEGLEQTLQAEVIFGDAARALPLIPEPGQPGVYTSTFIPVQPGDYTFHLTGTIGDTEIDESFTSAPEGVAPVDQRIVYEFPSAAQGSVLTELAMPVTLGLIAAGYGLVRWTSRRANG
jgi:hypothetical protein